MDACLETKTNYMDTANYEPPDTAKFEYKWQWAYKEKFEKAGITALLGSGFDPGVTGVFSAYALKHEFDEMNYIEMHGRVLIDLFKFVRINYKFPNYKLDTVCANFLFKEKAGIAPYQIFNY